CLSRLRWSPLGQLAPYSLNHATLAVEEKRPVVSIQSAFLAPLFFEFLKAVDRACAQRQDPSERREQRPSDSEPDYARQHPKFFALAFLLPSVSRVHPLHAFFFAFFCADVARGQIKSHRAIFIVVVDGLKVLL